ncbi:MAG: fatty acid--CoA ligase, partial [Alphaproteobacteria bacterium]|nr:fatty acid--CoA ligase [Alphaproteobacteria bacterium]
AFESLDQMAREQGLRIGERTAIVHEGGRLSYAELDRRVSRVANGLIAAGIRPGARIALLDKNDPSFFELMLGAIRARAVLVPVNFRLAAPEVAYILKDARAEMLFVGPDFVGLVEGIRDGLEHVRHIVAIAGGHADWPAFDGWRDAADGRDPELGVSPEDVAVQMYTSGTTGHPKGAQLTHRNFLSLLPHAIERWGRWHEKDVVLVCMPLFHIAGSGWGIVGLYSGATNLLLREVDPALILQRIPEYRVTKILFVPAVILFLLETPGSAATDFSSLELITYGASPIPLPVLERAIAVFGCGFAQLYGLTETTGAITYLPPEDHGAHARERMKSCGRAMPGVELRIVDAAGKDLPPGEVGEVICRSPQVMKGYWNLADATARAIRDGWFHTGDAGYMDEDGYLYIYDRVKDMIVSGGENIYPAEVESAIFSHPAIADAAVIGVPDEKWGEAVKAVVVLRPDARLEAEELISFLRGRIAGFKVPKSVDFVGVLPRNPSGKLLKRELRRPYWEGRERQVG